jgi:multidrug efflux pump subunit AcrA (membrane-fusion protein)
VLGSALRARMRLAEVYGTVVPRSAVLHDDHGAHVFVVKQGRAQRVTVETGIAEGDWIAVTGAIKPGIPVIVRGNYGLTDGMPVRSTGR